MVKRMEGASLARAIRGILTDLRNPNAPAEDVKRAVTKKFPHLREQVESQKNWGSYVSQQRDKAAAEMGVDRKKDQPSQPNLTREDYENARQLIGIVGRPEVAKEVLDFLSGKDAVLIRRAVKGWLWVMEETGGKSWEKAQAFAEQFWKVMEMG